jgi:hypothetical protein
MSVRLFEALPTVESEAYASLAQRNGGRRT